jgi:hypothetical protein
MVAVTVDIPGGGVLRDAILIDAVRTPTCAERVVFDQRQGATS